MKFWFLKVSPSDDEILFYSLLHRNSELLIKGVSSESWWCYSCRLWQLLLPFSANYTFERRSAVSVSWTEALRTIGDEQSSLSSLTKTRFSFIKSSLIVCVERHWKVSVWWKFSVDSGAALKRPALKMEAVSFTASFKWSSQGLKAFLSSAREGGVAFTLWRMKAASGRRVMACRAPLSLSPAWLGGLLRLKAQRLSCWSALIRAQPNFPSRCSALQDGI